MKCNRGLSEFFSSFDDVVKLKTKLSELFCYSLFLSLQYFHSKQNDDDVKEAEADPVSPFISITSSKTVMCFVNHET